MTAQKNFQAEAKRAAADQAAFAKATEARDSGISVGVVSGVICGVLGAVSMVSQGADKRAGLVGGIVGGVMGWAVGDLTKYAEINASGKIISAAISGSIAASTGALATQLADGLFKIPGLE